MSRVVVTDHAFPGLDHEQDVARRLEAEFAAHQCRSEEETREATADADVVFVNFAPITRDVLAGLADGAVVIRYGVGYENVDVEAASELRVRVANVPDYGTETVADHAAALLLALLRRLPVYDHGIREAGWCAPADVGSLPAFAAATVGLIGTGRIGLALADRLRAFGFTLLAFDPYADAGLLAGHGVEQVDLDELLARADAVSLHAPATDETRHIVDARALGKLKGGAVIVNTARGALVDEDALGAALADGTLGGAGLDVFADEPLAEGSPLRRHPNAILTPHAAFYSDASVDNLQRLAAEEAGRALAGEPLRCQIN